MTGCSSLYAPLQEDLTPETTKKVLEAFRKGEKPKPGPQSGRHTSENSAGLTALTSKVCRTACLLLSLSDHVLCSRTVRESTARPSSARYVAYPLQILANGMDYFL